MNIDEKILKESANVESIFKQFDKLWHKKSINLLIMKSGNDFVLVARGEDKELNEFVNLNLHNWNAKGFKDITPNPNWMGAIQGHNGWLFTRLLSGDKCKRKELVP